MLVLLSDYDRLAGWIAKISKLEDPRERLEAASNRRTDVSLKLNGRENVLSNERIAGQHINSSHVMESNSVPEDSVSCPKCSKRSISSCLGEQVEKSKLTINVFFL